MKKVLRIINRFNLGGPVYNALYLSKYLSTEYETLLIGGIHTQEETSAEFLFKEAKVSYQIIPEMSRSINPTNDIKAYQKINKIIKEFKPDIVHTHASKAGLLGRIAAIQNKVPVIVHTFHGHVFHSYFGKTKTTIIKKIERFLAKKSTQIIAISNIQKNDLTKKYLITSEDKTTVIPLGFDLSRFYENLEEKRINFRKKNNIKEKTIVIAIIGRIVPIKNHELLIDAINLLSKKTKNKIQVFIVGDGNLKAFLIEKIKKLKLDKIFTFTSWIKETDSVYAGADIIALSSRNEGTPVTLIEAQAANKAIITTDTGGIKDILMPSEIHIIAKHNAQDFSKKLHVLINKIQTKETDSSKEFAIKNFSYQRLVKDTESLYKKLLNNA